jgi:hypothetical protein
VRKLQNAELVHAPSQAFSRTKAGKAGNSVRIKSVRCRADVFSSAAERIWFALNARTALCIERYSSFFVATVEQ